MTTYESYLERRRLVFPFIVHASLIICIDQHKSNQTMLLQECQTWEIRKQIFLWLFVPGFIHHHCEPFLSNLLGFQKALYIMVSDKRWAHKIYSETTSYCFNLKFCQTNKTFRYSLPNANSCSKDNALIIILVQMQVFSLDKAGFDFKWAKNYE